MSPAKPEHQFYKFERQPISHQTNVDTGAIVIHKNIREFVDRDFQFEVASFVQQPKDDESFIL